MLDPMGKMYYSRLFADTEEDAYCCGYGFYKHRRREQAILVHHAVTWRLREEAKEARNGDKNSCSFVCTMRDVANAFPSIKHKALREVLEAGTDERTAVLLRSRHEQMEVKEQGFVDRHVKVNGFREQVNAMKDQHGKFNHLVPWEEGEQSHPTNRYVGRPAGPLVPDSSSCKGRRYVSVYCSEALLGAVQ